MPLFHEVHGYALRRGVSGANHSCAKCRLDLGALTMNVGLVRMQPRDPA